MSDFNKGNIEIVKCIDCKNYEPLRDLKGYGYCPALNMSPNITMISDVMVVDDFWCKFGVKNE